MNIDEKYKQKIINLIVALCPGVRVYLFGSHATHMQVHGSDIDIALDGGSAMPRTIVGEVREVLNATDIPYKIDVVDLWLVPEKMREQILKEGILWKS